MYDPTMTEEPATSPKCEEAERLVAVCHFCAQGPGRGKLMFVSDVSPAIICTNCVAHLQMRTEQLMSRPADAVLH